MGEKPVKVEKIDDLTVKITLPTASESFLYGISKISPIPKHVFEGESNIAKSEKIIIQLVLVHSSLRNGKR